jgi:hypothetical protein
VAKITGNFIHGIREIILTYRQTRACISVKEKAMYKKPPTQHRFKKGTSGNPAGRPKKTNISTLEKIPQNFPSQGLGVVILGEENLSKR